MFATHPGAAELSTVKNIASVMWWILFIIIKYFVIVLI